MRPKSIIWFERVVWLALLVGVFSTYNQWDKLIAGISARFPNRELLALGGQALFFSCYGALIWLTARRRSLVAKWSYVAAVIVTFVLLPLSPPPGFRDGWLQVILILLQYGLTLAAIELLFRPSASRWFKGLDLDPEIFR